MSPSELHRVPFHWPKTWRDGSPEFSRVFRSIDTACTYHEATPFPPAWEWDGDLDIPLVGRSNCLAEDTDLCRPSSSRQSTKAEPDKALSQLRPDLLAFDCLRGSGVGNLQCSEVSLKNGKQIKEANSFHTLVHAFTMSVKLSGKARAVLDVSTQCSRN